MWPDAARAHLEHEEPRVAASARSTVSGTPDLVVERALGRDRRPAGGEHLRRASPWCWSCPRAGQRDHGQVGQAVDHVAGQRVRARADRVVDDDARDAPVGRAAGRRRRPRRSPPRRSRGRRRARPRTATNSPPAPAARESTNAGAVTRRPTGSTVRELAADGVGDLAQRSAGSPVRLRQLTRGTSRSSNGCTTPPTSWPVSWPLPATTTVSPGPAGGSRSRSPRRRSPISCRPTPGPPRGRRPASRRGSPPGPRCAGCRR